MADPENHTLYVLRDIRAMIEALDRKIDRNQEQTNQRFDDVTERIEKLRKLAFGESVLGRYAAAEVEERLGAIEQRLSALEGHD
ncbi:hypothetical protein A33M_3972 [Rhodovulum sp. PH10]|uniref:hypothetical protein n=1 Tax=Rhodovulum sp. PH10 TaxID=1187851 RepID=UPI00027C23AC|nr:hypothetical protein [Rhodovulum sp. PH10]EJW10903.1 hypothetical protein A33M_3972 [Rhodovulum sp. PH10]